MCRDHTGTPARGPTVHTHIHPANLWRTSCQYPLPARTLALQGSSATYHVSSRGDLKEARAQVRVMKVGGMHVDRPQGQVSLTPVPLPATVGRTPRVGWRDTVIPPRQLGSEARPRRPQVPPSPTWHLLPAGEPAWGVGPTLVACRHPTQPQSQPGRCPVE